MKIKGQDTFEETGAFELKPGVEIIINSLPFGYDEKMRKELPSPTPPLKGLMGPDGKPVLVDAKRQKWKTEPDEDDPEYKKAEAAQTRRQVAFMIYHGTKRDTTLEWSTKEGPPEEFFQGIYEELVAANIPAGRIIALQSAIMEISHMDRRRIEAASAVFLDHEAREGQKEL
jgi:hypothetical protein